MCQVILGAGQTRFDGWIATDRDTFDITRHEDWEKFIAANGPPTKILCEHVLEHLLPHQAQYAARLMFKYLAHNGRARIAVPDGLHPDKSYIAHVAPPGCNHVALYDYRSAAGLFLNAGFSVRLLEWWDELRNFQHVDWTVDDGKITRSLRHDHRNWNGQPNFTSVILDCWKA